MSLSVAELRREYARAGLSEHELAVDPLEQFERWFSEARAASLIEPNAMVLGVVSAEGRPTTRMVLLKEVDRRGFVFYTNHQSAKGKALAALPWASLTFPWHPLERQVHVEGRVEIVERSLTEAYFASRPRASQLGAWASPQSDSVADRAELEARLAEVTAKFEGRDVPTPPHWGGYRVVPNRMEFWQGRPSRLHDRLVYVRQPPAQGDEGSEGTFRVVRLAP